MPSQPPFIVVPPAERAVVPGSRNLTATTLVNSDIIQIDQKSPQTAQITVSEFGRYFALTPYITPDDYAGWGQVFQDAVEYTEAIPDMLGVGSGTGLLDVLAAVGSSGDPALIGYQDEAEGAGKNIFLRGINRHLTRLVAANAAADQIMRWFGEADNRINLGMSGIGLEVGDIVTTRPLMTARNALLDVRDMEFTGNEYLSFGSGFAVVGFNTGNIAFNRFINMALVGINAGTGLDPGETTSIGNRATGLNYLFNYIENVRSNAMNIHGDRYSSMIGNTLVHDFKKYGLTKTNAGVRGGNSGLGMRAALNYAEWVFRGGQLNDKVGMLLAMNMFMASGGPGALTGSKDYIAGNNLITSNVYYNSGRLRGWPVPGTDSDDEDSSSSPTTGHNFLGGEAEVVAVNQGFHDYRRIGPGLISCTTASPNITLVDNYFAGSQYAGMSHFFPGDLVYKGGATDSKDRPPFLGRISTVDQPGYGVGAGGIGPRLVYSQPNGGGTLLFTIPYGTEPPSGAMVTGRSVVQTIVLDANALYAVGDVATLGIVKTITGISQANPGVVTMASTTGLTAGMQVVITGVSGMTQANNGIYTLGTVTGTTVALDWDTSAFNAWTSGGILYPLTGVNYRFRWLQEMLTEVNASCSLGTIAGTVLTVAGDVQGVFKVGQTIAGLGVGSGITITSLGTGVGGGGTYNLSGSATVATGVIITATSLEWVPTYAGEESYFNPYPNGGTITTTGGSANVTGVNETFTSTVSPFLTDQSEVVQYVKDSAGRMVTVGVTSSVSNNNLLVLTRATNLVVTGVQAWRSIENKIPYSYVYGQPDPIDSLYLRDIYVDWKSTRARGHSIGMHHVQHPSTIDPACYLRSQVTTVWAQSITTTTPIVILQPPIQGMRLRIVSIQLQFMTAPANNATNYVTLTAERNRAGTYTTISTYNAVAITNVARAAGTPITFEGPRTTTPTSGTITATDLIDPSLGDTIRISYGAAAAGNTLTDHVLVVLFVPF
jgi:hypothetical protein